MRDGNEVWSRLAQCARNGMHDTTVWRAQLAVVPAEGLGGVSVKCGVKAGAWGSLSREATPMCSEPAAMCGLCPMRRLPDGDYVGRVAPREADGRWGMYALSLSPDQVEVAMSRCFDVW